MPILGADPELVVQLSAPMFQQNVHGRAEAVAVVRMKVGEPVADGSVQRSRLQAEMHRHVRIVTMRSRATSQSQIVSAEPVSASDCRSRSEKNIVEAAARKGVLHDGETDHEDDQDEAAAQRRCTISLSSRPVIVIQAATSHAISSAQEGTSRMARS